MKKTIEAYKKQVFQAPPLFDKVVTIEGESVDTSVYRQSISKETASKKKPLVGSNFSKYIDGFM